MTFEKLYGNLISSGDLKTARNGETGYIIPLSALLEFKGGKKEFFKTIRKNRDGGFSVSRNVYYCPDYDRETKKYYPNCYTDICCNVPGLKKETLVFIGFDF